jgi:hypothetical protein
VTVFGSQTGKWDKSEGTLVLTVQAGQTMRAGEVYGFAVKLHNPHTA